MGGAEGRVSGSPPREAPAPAPVPGRSSQGDDRSGDDNTGSRQGTGFELGLMAVRIRFMDSFTFFRRPWPCHLMRFCLASRYGVTFSFLL